MQLWDMQCPKGHDESDYGAKYGAKKQLRQSLANVKQSKAIFLGRR